MFSATHGTNELSTEELIKHYGPKREWKHFNSLNTSFTRSGRMFFCFSCFFIEIPFFYHIHPLTTFIMVPTAKYYFYDNYFDLPGALLCGRVVDMLNKVVFISNQNL